MTEILTPSGAKLFKHQADTVLLMESEGRYGLWLDTGVGKTLTCLSFLERQRPVPTLVLCPKTIIEPAWLGDWERFGYRDRFGMVACTGTKKHRHKALAQVARGDAQVLVTNYEAFRADPAIQNIPWRCIILDESTRIMNHKAKTTVMVQAVCKRPEVRWCFALSGCPTPNTKLEFFSQVDSFRPGHLGRSFWGFRGEHFFQPNQKNAQWLWLPRPGAEDEIVESVSEVSRFLRKEECLDLPAVTHETRHLDLSRREREMYEKFLKTWILEFNQEVIVGATALTELMKLRQFTAGVVKMPDGEWEVFGDTKINALAELVHDIGRGPTGEVKPIVVVGQFRREIERAHQRLTDEGRRSGILYGGLSDDQRRRVIGGFQCGDLDCLVVHPASAGHGLTLTQSADMVFMSMDYSYERYYQVMQRIHRIGQHHPCTYHYLIARKTIDEDILKVLKGKESADLEMVKRFKELAQEMR